MNSAHSPSDGQEETYRYERKFTLAPMDASVFRHQLRLHPAGFRQAYPPRQVNNLYFDTWAYEHLFDNVEGVGERTKLRVRWYGDLLGQVHRPFLEYKIKKGLVGIKRRFDIHSFRLPHTHATARVVAAALQKSPLPPLVQLDLQRVRPAFLNGYQREYYQAVGFRLTLDTELQYFSPTRNGRPAHPPHPLVVELKYDVAMEREANRVVRHFGLRLMKNSKYVSGVLTVEC